MQAGLLQWVANKKLGPKAQVGNSTTHQEAERLLNHEGIDGQQQLCKQSKQAQQVV
jgi:hypothetical protein